jgi:arabinose-5-phosphate isomerase
MLIELIDLNIINTINNFNKFITNIPKKSLVLLIKQIINISNNNGIIYITGIGKSETIGINFSNLLKSISIKSFFLNCQNSLHGDIGTINNKDMIIMLSNSGNTCELLDIIDNLQLRKFYISSIVCNQNSKLKEFSNLIIELDYLNELENNINTIPTNSSMIQLITCNIIISSLTSIIHINKNQYKLNHIKGNIGNKLKKIKDIVIFNYPKIILEDFVLLNNVLLEMTKCSIGCCFFVNKNNEYIGLLTDGDIRRLLIDNNNFNIIKKQHINTNSYYETDIYKYLYEIDNIKNKKFIPIIENNKILGIISYKKF